MHNYSTTTISRAALIEALKSEKPERSAWGRGVQQTAREIVEEVDYLKDLPTLPSALTSALLNGARDWSAYSWGGCALVYDEDIARRYRTPSELKRTRGGQRRPNGREDWLDVQARALDQACRHVCGVAYMITRAERMQVAA